MARNSKVKVDCFSPGLITSSGLFRNQNPIFSKIFDFAASYFLQVSEMCIFIYAGIGDSEDHHADIYIYIYLYGIGAD